MINRLVDYYRKSKLIRDNVILFIGLTILNALGFFYHFYVGRVLGPSDYGILGALSALLYIILIALTTIQTGITKFVSDVQTKKQIGKISYLLYRSIKKLSVYSIILFLLFLALTPLIASYLRISKTPVIILGGVILFTLMLSVNRGILQGLQDFKNLSISYSVEGFSKFFGGILLIILGFGINGAIGAFTMSFAIALLLSFYPLRNIFNIKKLEFNTKEIYKYSFPVLLMLISLTALYSIDVIIVKHFFSEANAGYYSAASLLGKIIFFGTLSISQVMFPKVSELHSNNKEHKSVLYKSILISLAFIVPAVLAYFLIPGFIVNILFGEQFSPVIKLIGMFSIFMSLFSLTYLVAFYKISINHKKFLYILFLFNILEITLLYIFHNSLIQIIQILIILMASLFLILLASTSRKWSTFLS